MTQSFEFTTPRCSDSIEDLGDSHGRLFLISRDACSGYHQIRVPPCDEERLYVFTPDGKKKCFIVVPFGPNNLLTFYTVTMKILQDNWLLFLIKQNFLSPLTFILLIFFAIAKK